MRRLLCLVALAAALAGASACGSKSPLDMLSEASRVAESGDLLGAIEIVQKVKKMELDETTYGQAAMFLGTLYLYQQDYPAARKEFQAVLQRFGVGNANPMLAEISVQALGNICGTWFASKEPKKALDLVQATSATLAAKSPFRVHLAVLASETLCRMEKPDDGFRQLKEAIDAEPPMELLYQLGLLPKASAIRIGQDRLDEAAAVYLDYMKKHPDAGLEANLKRDVGRVYIQDPKGRPAMLAKGKEYFRQAVEAYDRAGQQSRDINEKAMITLNKAVAAWAMGDHAKSLDCMTSVSEQLAIAPELRAQAMFGLAECQLDAGAKDKAKEWYERIQREFPNQSMAANAAMALQDMSRKEAQEAILGPGPASSRAASAPASQAASAPILAPLAPPAAQAPARGR